MSNCIQAAFSSGGGGGGATVSVQQISPSANQTTTSTSLTNVTNGSATLASVTDGKALCTFFACVENSGENVVGIGFNYNGSDQESTDAQTHSGRNNLNVSCTEDTDGGTLQLKWRVNADTGTLKNAGDEQSRCNILEVG